MNPVFQPLTASLVPSACRLSAQAGWNQTAEDWLRLVRLAPDTVRVWVDAGEVRASYSVIAYGAAAAWIGMVLVDTAYRGGGVGKATFHAALESGHRQGVTVLGLDATDLGEPIYRKFGFETVASVARWGGVLAPEEEGPVVTGWSGEVAAIDREAVRVDRAPLLDDIARHDGTVFRVEEAGRTVAYALLRPGRTAWHLGPVVARKAADLKRLLAAAACVTKGGTVLFDALRPESAPLLEAAGLKPLRHLKRMTLPAVRDTLSGVQAYAGAGFEWG